jgi:hypothetical protein
LRVALPKFKYHKSVWLRFKLDQTWIVINKPESLISLKTNILSYEDDIMNYKENVVSNINANDYESERSDISNAKRAFTDMIGFRGNIGKELTKDERDHIEREKKRCEEYLIFDTRTQKRKDVWSNKLTGSQDEDENTDVLENYKTALAIIEDWKEGNKVKAFLNIKHLNPFINFIANGICHGVPYGMFQIKIEDIKLDIKTQDKIIEI